eukprot:TRINITY_DN2747_c0_g1_i1.p1 TRINITY_DN2747_c0_g1~~TRINITY_DN2747_c0_g1_i1.p1  ORF type:complete len:220 (-),score=14.54 TRINITY_DN2747_c0_g1_i1:11-670(-)
MSKPLCNCSQHLQCLGKVLYTDGDGPFRRDADDSQERFNHESRSFHLSSIWACHCEYSAMVKSLLAPYLEPGESPIEIVEDPPIIEIAESESDPEDPGPAFEPSLAATRNSAPETQESPDVEIISCSHARPTPSIIIHGISREQDDSWIERYFRKCDTHTWEFDYRNGIAKVHFRSLKHARKAFTIARKKQSSFKYSFCRESHPHWSVLAARKSGPVRL